MENRYFIIRRSCGFIGDVHQAFSGISQEKAEEQLRKHPNSELVFASPFRDDYVLELEKLRKEGINVY